MKLDDKLFVMITELRNNGKTWSEIHNTFPLIFLTTRRMKRSYIEEQARRRTQ